MAVRMNCSLQNTLSILSLRSNSNVSHLKSNKPYFHFPSSPRAALFCKCATPTPSNDDEPYVITTPLYYVNPIPPSPPMPLLAFRYLFMISPKFVQLIRLLGKKVIFITGTDEHGEKIATAATVQGSTPTDHCNLISQAYKTLWNDLDISYDKFIRTTDSKHVAVVKEFYSRVLANGDIYRADYEGIYSVSCEEYKDEKELLENNCCPIHLKPCVSRKEDNYFFALSKYQKSLEEILNKNPNFVQPCFRLHEVQEQPDLLNTVSSSWPATLHLIGKDILRFHAVYWPAMLMSAGLSLPKIVYGHGFLTKVLVLGPIYYLMFLLE
ncbi:putative methionine--tRNA ligase [Medicago truncatula]|uniref:Putative methionine--tRNA ligase n=1 Tax=Medicago truncatula TaxID=3880 RepID=A0A396JKK1_MEDTR|nr:putative methionine--tRNA ligase [Medicago truncatula]